MFSVTRHLFEPVIYVEWRPGPGENDVREITDRFKRRDGTNVVLKKMRKR